MLLKANCKDCQKRYPGCHDHCEDYQACRKKYLEEKAKEREVNFVRNEAGRRALEMSRNKKRKK